MKLIDPKSQQFKDILYNLKADTIPRWGQMYPDQMLGHLITVAQVSNGKITVDFAGKEEHLPKLKYILHKAEPFPKEFKAPAVVEAYIQKPVDKNLPELIAQLLEEMQDFQKHFEGKATDYTLMNAVFGPLNYNDWLVFHQKHLSHHLAQFNLWEY